MGCSASKLDNEEAVQLCKDRKKFIKQALEYRTQFACGHIAYIQSMKRVSAALREYIEGDEPREFLLDSYRTRPFKPIKKTGGGFISISPKSFSVTPLQFETKSSLKINYMRSGGNPSFSVEERPESPKTVHIETYSPAHHYGVDGFFGIQPSAMDSSFFSYSPINRSNLPPASPQISQWDFFWNPFSSLDYYGYPSMSSIDQRVLDDEMIGLRQVREEEGIPELEEETEQEEHCKTLNMPEERVNIDASFHREVLVEEEEEGEEEEEEEEEEDDDDDDDDGGGGGGGGGDGDGCDDDKNVDRTDSGNETDQEMEGLRSHGSQSIELSKAQKAGQFGNQETTIGDQRDSTTTPGFTVYINRRSTSMSEVIKDLEAQFMIVCNAADEISAMLEASKSQYLSTSNELTGEKISFIKLSHSTFTPFGIIVK
ncbi:hypothetical protein U1Q18_047065 [Sarracenia purpurea var. burkii]